MTDILPRQTLAPSRQGDLFDPAATRWVLHPSDLPELWTAVVTSTEVVIDLETTGLNEHQRATRDWPADARIVCAALTLPQPDDDGEPTNWVLALSHPESPMRGAWRTVLAQLCRTIVEAHKPITNQNLGFDMRWIFAATGVDLTDLYSWDTQISSHLLDENASTRLKERAPATFGVQRWDDHDLSTPAAAERVPFYELGLYAARDTYWTWRLAVLHRTLMNVGAEADPDGWPADPEEAQDFTLGRLAINCAMPMGATLTAMSQRGMLLDVDWTRAEITRLDRLRAETSSWLQQLHPVEGDVSWASTSNYFIRWTEAAVAAGDLRITAMTDTGKPQWNKAVLSRQARLGSEAAERLLVVRQCIKHLEYLRSWIELTSPRSTVHATYHAGRVVTGRLSSSNPNMQQVTKVLKSAFVPRPGHLIAELDYSQIELRVAAFVSRCEPMIEAYQRGDDLHRMLAGQITRKPVDQVTKEERQDGKAGNFGFLYGMSAEGFRDYAETNYGVGFTPDEAERVRRAFFETWAGLSEWHERMRRTVHATGQVVSPIGRVRRLPDIWDGNDYLVGGAERQAINSPVQGFASDLMQMAAASIEGLLPGHVAVPHVRLVGTVHDSIIAEVPADDWKRATARCMRRMISIPESLKSMGCSFDVPLGVEATVGTRWGAGDVGIIS